MIPIPSSQIIPVNSVSYVDMLGVLAGLERLPGETSDLFAERIELAISADRGPGYAGLMNSLALAFGLEMREVIRIEADVDFQVSVQFGLLRLRLDETTSYLVQLLEIAEDNFWEWRKISDVVADIPEPFRAEMIGEDGPAFEIVLQSNTLLVSGEELSGAKTQQLAHSGLIAGSEIFSQQVPSYTVGSDRRTLHFVSPPAAGARITYRRRVCPYQLIASPVAAFSLLDPNVRLWSEGANGHIVYQVREYLQELMLRDGSYWGK